MTENAQLPENAGTVEKRRTSLKYKQGQAWARLILESGNVKTSLSYKIVAGKVTEPYLISTKGSRVLTSMAIYDGMSQSEAFKFAYDYHEHSIQKFAEASQKRVINRGVSFLKGLFK